MYDKNTKLANHVTGDHVNGVTERRQPCLKNGISKNVCASGNISTECLQNKMS